MFNPDKCDKCEYNEKHGIYNYRTILKLVEKADVDTIIFSVYQLQQRLTDQEIQYLCDAFSGELSEADRLFIELHHMNEVLA
jgi:hypothetical protein